MIGHFKALLQNLVESPNRSISQVQMLTEAERWQLLVGWNQTARLFSEEASLNEIFEPQVERSPEAVALVYGDSRLTYRELNVRANQLAHYLGKTGVGPDVLVGICMERSIEMVVSVFGVLKSGGAYVPLDPGYPTDRLNFMLADARAPILITQESLSINLPAPGTRKLCIDREWPIIAQESGENICVDLSPDNLAYVIYTSGSTGKPKGTALPHRALVNLIEWQESTHLAGVNTLQFASLSFDVSFQEIFASACSGGTLYIVSESLRTDIEGLARYLIEEKIEKMISPVVVAQLLADYYCDDENPFPNLKEVAATGEKLQITLSMLKLFRRLKHCVLLNHYGPSETHVVTEYDLGNDPDRWQVNPSIGQPIANIQIYILDRYMNPAPVGVPGDLYIGGVGLARGYLNRPDMTAEKFIPNPFSESGEGMYKSGDVARYLSDGNIEFLGRSDFQMKVRGFRIEPGEIEATLLQHESISEVLVTGYKDALGNASLIAYFVAARASSLRAADLRAFLCERIPEYMVPSHFIMLEVFPLNTNGKIDRHALPAPEAMLEFDSQFVAPRTAAEEIMAQIWSQVLRVERIGIYDNFFGLGGHSLRATQVMFRLREIFAVDLSVRIIFEMPTVEGLVTVINNAYGDSNVVDEIARAALKIEQLSPEEIRLLLSEESTSASD